ELVRSPHWNWGREVGSGEGDQAAVGECECSAEQSHFEGRIVFGVADEKIADPRRNGIGCSGRRDSDGSIAETAEILHSGEHPWGLDLDYWHGSSGGGPPGPRPIP